LNTADSISGHLPVQAPYAPGVRYAAARNAERLAARERIHARVTRPIETPALIEDPLSHGNSKLSSVFTVARLLVVAVVIHGLIVVVLSAVNGLMGEHSQPTPKERVTVQIFDKPPPPPTPPTPAIEEEAVIAPVPTDFEKIDKPQPPPRPPKRPVEKKRSRQPAPVKKATEAPAEPQRRRVVGISGDSTVEGGNGPAFQVGTTRMGETEKKAIDPKEASKPPTPAPPSSGSGEVTGEVQRVASRIPTRDAVFVKPKRTQPSKPPYPPTLKAQGIEGNVLVRVHINETGRVTRVKILGSSGHQAFDNAAKTAARNERFTPATRDGKAVPFTLSYSYRFRIEDD
jgi:periplasmic protein TonB